jgi:hypothetical protein
MKHSFLLTLALLLLNSAEGYAGYTFRNTVSPPISLNKQRAQELGLPTGTATNYLCYKYVVDNVLIAVPGNSICLQFNNDNSRLPLYPLRRVGSVITAEILDVNNFKRDKAWLASRSSVNPWVRVTYWSFTPIGPNGEPPNETAGSAVVVIRVKELDELYTAPQ